MDKLESFRKYLERIKDRFYRPVIFSTNLGLPGMVTHHGDCNIHRIDYPHCSCGLIHDLKCIYEFADIIWPKFGDDSAVSDGMGTIYDNPTPEEVEERTAMIAKAFGQPVTLPPDMAEESQSRLAIIMDVFGEHPMSDKKEAG